MFRKHCQKCTNFLFFAFIIHCCALPSVLYSQAQRGPQQQARQGFRRNESLDLILNMIQERPPASIVSLHTTSASFDLSNILQRDPAVALNLNLVVLDAESGAGLELIEREGWPKGAPRWAILSTNGRVLNSSDQAPTPDSIMDAFRGAGLKSRLDEMRSFLAIYPHHAEATLALLGELRAIAQAKTSAALGVSQGARQGGAMNPLLRQAAGDVSLEPLPQLDTWIDSEIWGEYSREAENAFQEGIWKQDTEQLWGDRGGGMGMGFGGSDVLFRGGGTSLVSDFAIYSPMMKRQYQRWLPDIEHALARRASSTRLWNFWLAVQRVSGGRDISVFKATLPPPLNGDPNDMPPTFVRSQWIRDCINRGDLRMAEMAAKEEWENLFASQNAPRQGRPVLGGGIPGRGPIGMSGSENSFDARSWNTAAEPYIEILLRQQKTGSADAILQQWLAMQGWQGAAQRARALANRLGFQDLAAKWGAQAPPTAPQPLIDRRPLR
ncbi:MAG: hypothetical protein LBC63_05625 [Holophagales bacterium]|jgi:hypothetical protein|nr:hypothetical protein [Holophagales bacterium]